MLALPDDVVSLETRIGAHLAVVEDAMELGDRDALDGHLTAAYDLAEVSGHPYWRWATTSWRALVTATEGALDEAERLAHEAFGYQAPAAHPEAVAALGVETVLLRLLSGRAAEVIDLLAGAADANPQIPCYRAVLALCCAQAGDADGTRDAYEAFRSGGFMLPPDSNWLLGTTVLADIAATLGDRSGAAVLAETLRPFAGRHAVLNCYGAGGAAWGPVDLQLARLAATLGEEKEARRFLDRAVALAASMRTAPFSARADLERARLGSP